MKYMKRSLSILLCLMLIISAFSAFPAGAYDVEVQWGTNINYIFKDGVITFTGTGDMSLYDEGERPYDFDDIADDIKTVVIGSGITSVSDYAFKSLDNLETVNLPSSLAAIGEYAFSGCPNLTSVNLSDLSDLKTIGADAFSYCDNLQAITIPAKVTSVGSKAFYYCELLSSVEIKNADGNNQTDLSILSSAFASCTSLTGITLPKRVCSIGSRCFANSGITEMTIERQAFDSIGSNAFLDVSHAKITVPYGFCINYPDGGSSYNKTDLTSSNYTTYFGAKNYILFSDEGKYNVYWLDENGDSTLEADWAVEAGSTPEYNGTYSKEGYVMKWNPEIAAVSGNAFYTAVFSIEEYDIFVEGIHITSQNASDVLGDGTVKFVPVSESGNYNILYLNNAEIEVVPRGDGENSESEFGICADGIADFRISCEGENTIKDTETSDTTTEKYGIAVYGETSSILGSGTLNISMSADDSDITYCGIRNEGGTVSEATVNINIPGNAPTKGLYIKNDNTCTLSTGAKLMISTGSSTNTYSVDTDSSSNPNFYIADGECVLEVGSDNFAFGSSVNLGRISGGESLFVNTENDRITASEWDESTALSTYKYIRYNYDGYTVTVSDEITGGTVSSDRTSAFGSETVTLKCSPEDGYYLSELTVKDSSDNEIETVKTDSGYTFTMPESNVTVSAVFEVLTEYNLFVGGTQVTSENMDDVFGDGTVKFVPVSESGGNYNYLYLNNAEIEVATREDGGTSEAEFGIRANDMEKLRISLEGVNTIKDTETSDSTTTKYGIAVYKYFSYIEGSGTLNISMNADDSDIVYYGIRNVGYSVSAATLNINIPGTAQTKGIFIQNSNKFGLIDNASLMISTGSNENTYSVDTDGSLNPNLYIGSVGSAFEVRSDNYAFSSSVNFYISSSSAILFVNADNVPASAAEWDKSTSLSTYKYIRYNFDGYTVTVSDEITNGTVSSDKTSAYSGETVTLTSDPDDGYMLGELTVKDSSDNEIETVKSDSGYTFTMPEGNVTVSAVFEEITKYGLYVGGTQVTSENMDDVFGDGTVKYVPVSESSGLNTLYLNNAEIEVAPREGVESEAVEFGIRANGIEDLRISLEGENTIKDTKTSDSTTEKYGIAVYGDTSYIVGSGTLNISMNADDSNIVYYGIRNVGGTISAATVNIDIPGTAQTKGLYIKNDNRFVMGNDASLMISTGSSENTYSVDTDSNVKTNFYLGSEGCVLEARSDNHAFSGSVSFAKNSSGENLFVNTENDRASATEWDESTALSTYKYIRYNYDGYTVTVSDEITGGTVSSDKTSAFGSETVTLTCSPDDGYYLSELTVKDSSDNEIETEKSDSGYTFTMPESNVTVSAVFEVLTKYGLHVGGTQITSENMDDVFGDGTVRFVPVSESGSYNYLYLSNAEIEVEPREDGVNEGYEFGIRANGIENMRISLEGVNTIKDTETADGTIEKYGIAVYGNTSYIVGSGTLNISMNADDSNIVYYGIRNVGGTISAATVNINIPGTAETKGLYIKNDNRFGVGNNASLMISTGSNENTYSVDTDSSLNTNFYLSSAECVFEARSDDHAFSSSVSFAKNSSGENLFVNTENDRITASEWDESTALSTYKYIRYNYDGYTVTVSDEITGGTVSSDRTSAYSGETVTLTCSPDDGYYLSELTVKDSSDNEIETEKSDSGYTFTMPESNVTVSAVFVTKIFSGHSLTLDGTIGINYFLNLTDEDIQNGVTVDFTWTSLNKERTASYTVTADDYIEDLGLYKATCHVAAAEMTCDVTASCTIGEETECDVDIYSVYEYGNYILSEEYAAEESLSNLVKSLLRYGSNAQTQFNSNTDILADCMLTSTDPDSSYYYNPSDDFEIESQKTEMEETILEGYGLEYAGASATYLTEMSLRLYYRITDENNFAEFLSNYPDFVYHRNSSRDSDLIYIEQENIAPADFDKAYLFEIAAASCKYSILDYVKECIDGNVSDNMKALARATYHYNCYADLYFTD